MTRTNSVLPIYILKEINETAFHTPKTIKKRANVIVVCFISFAKLRIKFETTKHFQIFFYKIFTSICYTIE